MEPARPAPNVEIAMGSGREPDDQAHIIKGHVTRIIPEVEPRTPVAVRLARDLLPSQDLQRHELMVLQLAMDEQPILRIPTKSPVCTDVMAPGIPG
jgi:hypothetical protein